MADLSDVENAIVSEIIGALYPLGIGQVSVTGTTCRVYRGWPSPASLNSDLAAGIVNVTILPGTKPDEVPDPYFDRSYNSIASTSLAATIAGRSITFSGLTAINQIVGVLVDGTPFLYRVNEGDTTESIAANLGVLINADRFAMLSGSTLTIPGAGTMTARIVTNATVTQGLRRQRREIQVNFWSPSPALRDSVSRTVDIALTAASFIGLADQTKAHVHYVSTQIYDQSENALLYRRDLCYKCEYTMISSATAPVMLFGDLFKNGSSAFV
jgi:hypothetical protein